MPLSKISEARELSDEELSEQIELLKRELFDLRMQKATRRLETPHRFKQIRHQIAQMMTVETERRRMASASDVSEE